MGFDGKHRPLVKTATLAAALSLAGSAADACRLGLILAMDISNLVDYEATMRRKLLRELMAQQLGGLDQTQIPQG
jgi:hypothetical protein